MDTSKMNQLSQTYLNKLCQEIPGRGVGSEGNRMATRFFAEEMASFGWEVEQQEFAAIDWKDEGAQLINLIFGQLQPGPEKGLPYIQATDLDFL